MSLNVITASIVCFRELRFHSNWSERRRAHTRIKEEDRARCRGVRTHSYQRRARGSSRRVVRKSAAPTIWSIRG